MKTKIVPKFSAASHCHLQGNVCGLMSLIVWSGGGTQEEVQGDGWNLHDFVSVRAGESFCRFGRPPWSFSCDCCSLFLELLTLSIFILWPESFICSAMADVTWPFVVVYSLSLVAITFWMSLLHISLYCPHTWHHRLPHTAADFLVLIFQMYQHLP